MLGFGDHKRALKHGRKSVGYLQEQFVQENTCAYPSVMEMATESTPLKMQTNNSIDDDIEDEQLGSSGFYHSTFNAVNVLAGVGILSLPFAFKIAGWFLSFTLLISFMLLTNYTARIVARCLDYQDASVGIVNRNIEEKKKIVFDDIRDDVDSLRDTLDSRAGSSCSHRDNFAKDENTLRRDLLAQEVKFKLRNEPKVRFKRLMTYGDIGEASFGTKGRLFISIVFTLELFAAGVALIILMADSLHSLFPSQSLFFFKFVSFALVTPSLWLKQLKWLSYTSILGILTIVNLLAVIIIDGVTKKEAPGSIVSPEVTDMFPPRLVKVPVVFGLIMAGFAGHAVFPNIYREMRDPKKFSSVVNSAYVFTFLIYATMASLGYLMFGKYTLDEITKNLSLIPEYNKFLNSLTIWLVVVNPMTKYALTLQPVATSFELMISRSSASEVRRPIQLNICTRQLTIPFDIFRIILRSLISALVVLVAITFPGFERIISLLGSLFSFIVSVLFPILCYIRLYGWQMSVLEKSINLLLFFIGSLFAFTGTVWSFLPASVVGIHSRNGF